MRRKLVPNLPHGDVIVMSLASSQILYAYLREPDTLTVFIPLPTPSLKNISFLK